MGYRLQPAHPSHAVEFTQRVRGRHSPPKRHSTIWTRRGRCKPKQKWKLWRVNYQGVLYSVTVRGVLCPCDGNITSRSQDVPTDCLLWRVFTASSWGQSVTVGVQGPLWSPGPAPSPHTMRETHSGEEDSEYPRESAKHQHYHRQHSNHHQQQQHDNAQNLYEDEQQEGDHQGKFDNNNGSHHPRHSSNNNKNNNKDSSAVADNAMAVTPVTTTADGNTSNSNHHEQYHQLQHSSSVPAQRHSFSNGSPPSGVAGESEFQPMSAREPAARQTPTPSATSRLHRSSTEPSVAEQGSSGHPASRTTLYERLSSDLANDPRVMKEITLGRRIAFYRIRGEIGTGNFSQVKMGIHVLTKGKSGFFFLFPPLSVSSRNTATLTCTGKFVPQYLSKRKCI